MLLGQLGHFFLLLGEGCVEFAGHFSLFGVGLVFELRLLFVLLFVELLQLLVVVCNLHVLVVDLLLKHARDLGHVLVVLGDLAPRVLRVRHQLLQAEGALLQADVVAGDLVGLLLLLGVDELVGHLFKLYPI